MYNPGRFPACSVAMVFDAGNSRNACGCCRHSPISNPYSRPTRAPVAMHSADEDGVPERMNQDAATKAGVDRTVSQNRNGNGPLRP